MYLNPADDFNYERKQVWIVRHDNLIFGSGWYEREVSLESTPSAYARALVEQAVARYDAEGRMLPWCAITIYQCGRAVLCAHHRFQRPSRCR